MHFDFIVNKLPNIDITPAQWNIISAIFKKHLPNQTVWAFGSRAKRKAKPYSDLDLAIISKAPLSIHLIATLEHAFTESDLPFKVDLVDWAATSADFKKIIENHHIVLL